MLTDSEWLAERERQYLILCGRGYMDQDALFRFAETIHVARTSPESLRTMRLKYDLKFRLAHWAINKWRSVIQAVDQPK
jgi:hypothetical protein